MSAGSKQVVLMTAIDIADVALRIRTRFTNDGEVLGRSGLAADIDHLRELLDALEKQVLR